MPLLRLLNSLITALVVFLAAAPGALAQTASPFAGGAWCGNVTASTATVKVRLASPGQAVRLALATNAKLDGAI